MHSGGLNCGRHWQVTLGAVPAQPLGARQSLVAPVAQPLASAAQLVTVTFGAVPVQNEPGRNAPLTKHSAGAVVVQVQAALPGLPRHGLLPPGQVPFALLTTTQFCALSPHVT